MLLCHSYSYWISKTTQGYYKLSLEFFGLETFCNVMYLSEDFPEEQGARFWDLEDCSLSINSYD